MYNWNSDKKKPLKLLHDCKYFSKRGELLTFYAYLCHVIRNFVCSLKLFSGMYL